MAWGYDGSSQYTKLLNSPVLNFPDGDWTFCVWARVSDNSGTGNPNLLSIGDDAATVHPYFNLAIGNSSFGANNADDVAVTAGDDDTDKYGSVSSHNSETFSDTNWHHILVEHTTTFIRMFTDGVFRSQLNNVNFDGMTFTTDMFLGAGESLGAATYWLGELAGLGKWDRILSATEKALLAEDRVPPEHPVLKDALVLSCSMREGFIAETGDIIVENFGAVRALHPPMASAQKIFPSTRFPLPFDVSDKWPQPNILGTAEYNSPLIGPFG